MICQFDDKWLKGEELVHVKKENEMQVSDNYKTCALVL